MNLARLGLMNEFGWSAGGTGNPLLGVRYVSYLN